MPNRIIKESINTSDNLNMLTSDEEVFFYHLLVTCDDYGIADARIPIIRAKCFPLKLDKVSEKDVSNWLKALVKTNLVFIYEVDGRQYLKMTSWEKHQQIRAKKSKFPLPNSNGYQMISSDDMCSNDEDDGYQMISDDDICPRNPIQSNPNTNAQIDLLWSMYPKKKGKAIAVKKIPKLINQFGYDQILRCIERYSEEIKNKSIAEQYIKQGDTFFNSGYMDYLDENFKCTSEVEQPKKPRRTLEERFID